MEMKAQSEVKKALELYQMEVKILKDERALLNKREDLAFERYLDRLEHIDKQGVV